MIYTIKCEEKDYKRAVFIPGCGGLLEPVAEVTPGAGACDGTGGCCPGGNGGTPIGGQPGNMTGGAKSKNKTLTLYTQTSVIIFSKLFSIYFLKCWQGEFV